MHTLEEIRKANRWEFSPLSKLYKTPVQLTEEHYEEGRRQYEEFVKPVSQSIFGRKMK